MSSAVASEISGINTEIARSYRFARHTLREVLFVFVVAPHIDFSWYRPLSEHREYIR